MANIYFTDYRTVYEKDGNWNNPDNWYLTTYICGGCCCPSIEGIPANRLPQPGDTVIYTSPFQTPYQTGPILTAGVANGGTGYANGTYSNVPLTSVSSLYPSPGTGATANITVAGGKVTSISIVSGGAGYSRTGTEDGLTVSPALIGGQGSGLVIKVTSVYLPGGTGKITSLLQVGGGNEPLTATTPNQNVAVTVTGGSGTGASASVSIGQNGSISSYVVQTRYNVVPLAQGSGYKVGDILYLTKPGKTLYFATVMVTGIDGDTQYTPFAGQVSFSLTNNGLGTYIDKRLFIYNGAVSGKVTLQGLGYISAGVFSGPVAALVFVGVPIRGGTFSGTVSANSISGGTFTPTSSVTAYFNPIATPYAYITGGIFQGSFVPTSPSFKVTGGSFTPQFSSTNATSINVGGKTYTSFDLLKVPHNPGFGFGNAGNTSTYNQANSFGLTGTSSDIIGAGLP